MPCRPLASPTGHLHGMAHGGQLGRQGVDWPGDFSSRVGAVHVELRAAGRWRPAGVMLAVQHGDQGLGDIVDDGRAAGRAHRQTGSCRPCRTRWWATWPMSGRLPGAGALATGLPSRTGSKEKSVSVLLRKKPFGHDLGAEDRFHRGGHGDHLAAVVHDGHVAGAVQHRRALRRIVAHASPADCRPVAVPMSLAGSISAARLAI